MQKFANKFGCTSLILRSSMSIRESSLSWSGVMVVEVTGRASCLGGAAAVHTSLRDYTANYRNGLICVLFFLANHLVLHSDFTNCWAVLGWS